MDEVRVGQHVIISIGSIYIGSIKFIAANKYINVEAVEFRTSTRVCPSSKNYSYSIVLKECWISEDITK